MNRQFEGSQLVLDKHYVSLNKTGEELCGDRVFVSESPQGTAIVMSDGLGSGVKANILATITAQVAVTMLRGGADVDEVVETLGRTLPVCKVRKLAYATFSILQITPGGYIYLAEFDNPGVFFFRDGQRIPLQPRTRSVGGSAVREASWQGKEGDLLVAISDGIVHAGLGTKLSFGWLHENVGAYVQSMVNNGLSPKDVCTKVLDTATAISSGSIGDDATVLALRLRPRRSLTMAVGPPADRSQDAAYVRALNDEKDMRVVCGGTTATLVARELGSRVHVDLDDVGRGGVPPMGSIPGIDLVTEGILTISEALSLMRGGRKPKTLDGAVRVADHLTVCDDVHFLVGRALNPAHQNPDLPVELALKPQVIREIAELLEAGGKTVTTTFF